MPGPALLVPIVCDALVANAGVIRRDPLRWWAFNYHSLDYFRSPEPAAMDRAITGQTLGVYLGWTLPAALREGQQDQRTGAISYPLVPNRWLILRVQGTTTRKATGWILESDCPLTAHVGHFDASRTSQYLVDPGLLALWRNSGDAYRTAYTPPANPAQTPVANIGIPFVLDAWQERAASAMFLTAVAPANPLFSGYLPHHLGVFSFYDDLAGIDVDTLSYYVIGWYSDAARDIAASWNASAGPDGFAALLARLRWTLAKDDPAQPVATIYEGGCFNITWNRSGAPPAPDPLQAIRDSGGLNVALGNTTIDAFTALVGQQIPDPAIGAMLRALNYDLLQVLNQVNGDALLQERIHQEWFGTSSGGSAWAIMDQHSDGALATELTAAEAAWLAQLNGDQAKLDDALATLYVLQWTLNALWYKFGYLGVPQNVFPQPPEGIPGTVADFRQQLSRAIDPGAGGSVAEGVTRTLADVKNLLTRVPQPIWKAGSNQEDAFQAGIAAFAATKQLDPTKVLKALPGPRYWLANNPVVVLSGVQPPFAADPNQPLTIRVSSQLVRSFTMNGVDVSRVTAGAAMLTLPNAAALPELTAALIDELFLLDPANAAALATAAQAGRPDGARNYQDVLPAMSIEPWTQPWAPLFMEWRGQYMPIPEATLSGDNWIFDGTDYHFDGVAPPPGGRLVGGISLLSPHAQFVFGSRLRKFADQFPERTEIAKIWQEIDQVFHWKFLAQELVGFNQSLALRDVRAFRRPLPSETVGAGANQRRVTDLAGYDDGADAGPDALPDSYRGRVNTIPLIPNGPALPFEGVRGGQFYFTDLLLYDRFGRVLRLISSGAETGLYDATNFPAVLDNVLIPVRSIAPTIKTVAELAPRTLQLAQLDIRLIDQRSDAKVFGTDPDVMPICGWLLPNHLDHSVLLFAPDGTSLGDIRITVGLDGVSRTATWAPPVHGSVTSLSDVASRAPHLATLIQAREFQAEASFTAFLSAIDATLWTIDPLGARSDQNLSVLIGRPLALVRARLQFVLDGPPIRDTGWAATLDTSPPAYLSRQFAIRLGDQATREDGTVGYYAGNDYSTFNSVAAPETTGQQNYVRLIGPLGVNGGKNYLRLGFAPLTFQFVTLLIDPRASVHATTGIVPVTQLDIPPHLVDDPLANMEVGFRMGPVISSIQATPAQGDKTPAHPQAVTYPAPAEQGGTWSWWETAAGGANGFDIIPATNDAKLGVNRASLREGVLQLAIHLTKNG